MIVSVGDTSIDHYVATGEKYVGGIATNFAVHMHRLNEPVVLITAIGNDEDANFFLRRMQEEGIDISRVHHMSGETSEQKIRTVGKERSFDGFFGGVLTQFRLSPEDIEFMKSADAVVSPLTDGLKAVFEQIMEADIGSTIKVVDFSRDADIEGFGHGDVIAMMMHYIDYFNIAFIGGDDSMVETIKTIGEANPKKLLVLTLGPKGSIVFHQGKEFQQPAVWVKNMIDTTGCGDAFRAGFLKEYLKTKKIILALESGSKLAADAGTHIGGF